MNRVYHEDCFNIFPQLEDKSIDLVLCDMPYGTTACKWDTVIDLERMWKELDRIAKNNAAIVLTASQPFTSVLGSSNISNLRYSLVYEKNIKTGHLNAKKMPMSSHEDILVFYKIQPTYNPQGILPYNKIIRRGSNGECYGNSGKSNLQEYTNYPTRIIKIRKDTFSVHPTQKPVALMEYLIKTYSNEGNTVLDFCMGSGTTGVACKNLNRQFIGIEKEEKYFQIAERRIENE